MNDERDPLLESLFIEAERELVDESYTSAVMAKIRRRGRLVMAGRFAILALVVLFEFLLSAPLQNSLGTITEALSTSLVGIDNDWLALAFAPINSVAGLIGIMLLAFHALYRRVIR